MNDFKSQEEYENYLSFHIPPTEVYEALNTFKKQLIQEPFKYDTWKAADGVKYLAGIYDYGGDGDAQYLTTLENVHYETNPSMYIIHAFHARLDEFNNIWASGEHPEKNSPQYYVRWALSKKLPVPWLSAAKEQGLLSFAMIDDGHASGSTVLPHLDSTSPTYPPELDMAIRAWVAISSTDGKGKPKKRIIDWLKMNNPSLSNEAMERIAVVANWDKKGGATASD